MKKLFDEAMDEFVGVTPLDRDAIVPGTVDVMGVLQGVQDIFQGQVVLDLDGEPNAEGWLNGRCPFHDDRSPSFGVNVQTAVWHCFKCGGGGLYRFLRRMSAEYGNAQAHLTETEARTLIDLNRIGDGPSAVAAPRLTPLEVAQLRLARRFRQNPTAYQETAFRFDWMAAYENPEEAVAYLENILQTE